MIFPAVETLTCSKLMLFLEQLPDWHLDAITTHAVRALRSKAAGEILSAMPMPALPRPPQPQLTLPEARRLLWHHLRIALAGWHEVECWHVVEAYEGVLEGMPKENQAI
jgi:hypothetical protein